LPPLFVVFFSPVSRTSNSSRGGGTYGSINGKEITQEDFNHAYQEVLLQYFFSSGGQWLADADRNSFEPEKRTYFRLLMIQKQEELGIHISSETAAQFATQYLKRFGIDSPALFIEKALKPHNVGIEDLDRYIRHELGIQELMATVALSGKLLTPEEIKGIYLLEHEELTTQAVFFSGSNYLSEVSAPPDAVGQFYTNQMASYRLPERLQVRYVRFPLSNHLATVEKQLTNLNEIVEANFQRYGSNYLKDAKSPEEAKAKLREDILERQALTEASKEARKFATTVFSLDPRPENLELVAKSNGLPAQISPPFDKDNPPKELDINPDFTKIAFNLSPEEPFAPPIPGRDGVYVIGFHKKIPSEIPPFESIRDKVTFDYKYTQALTLARKAGAEFDKMATNGLAQGKTFDTICAEAKVKPVTVPPFSLVTRELPEVEGHISFRQYREIAFATLPGKTSGFQPTMDGGVDIFVKSKVPPDETKLKTELPGFIASARRTRQQETFELWFRKEAEKALRDLPYFQRLKDQQQVGSRTAKS